MATSSKTAAKPTTKAKSVTSAKTAAPAKKAMATKTLPDTPVKDAAASKAVPDTAKKTSKPVVATREVAQPKPAVTAKKAAPSKKDEPVKKAAPSKATVPEKASAKTAAPAKKTVEPVKAETGKKEAPAKKPVAAKPVPVAEKPKVKPEPKPVPAKPVAKMPEKKAPIPVRKEPIKQMPVKPVAPTPRPTATPASRSVDKKPGVVIAHRRMENKAKIINEVANTMIQYQPETYRSILDEPQIQQGPAYRYSDEDLSEFREIIASRVDAARKELNYLQGLITRKDEAGTEDTENRYMNMEDGSGAMEREQLAQLASRQIQFMGHLEKALVRIENKTYGICRVTGKLIDKARLRAVPHATLSIDAKKMMASKQN